MARGNAIHGNWIHNQRRYGYSCASYSTYLSVRCCILEGKAHTHMHAYLVRDPGDIPQQRSALLLAGDATQGKHIAHQTDFTERRIRHPKCSKMISI